MPWLGQGRECRGVSVIPCISPGVGEGRKSCLLFSVLRGNLIAIQDRHVQPVAHNAQERYASVAVTVAPVPFVLI